MADFFIDRLLIAYNEVGTLRRGAINVPSLLYEFWLTTPLGVIPRTPASMWSYLCDHPDDGWEKAPLVLSQHLIHDPVSTLYVGAGSGRMVRALLNAGIPCQGADIEPKAVELMALRGMTCGLMNAEAMTYADGSFARVVLHDDGLLDSLADPTAAINEAARVATEQVIITGYEIDPNESTPVTFGMASGGEEYEATYCAHPITRITSILQAAGMSVDTVTEFGEDWDTGGLNPFGTYYIIKAEK